MQLACIALISLTLFHASSSLDNDKDWDYMVFTQSWPPASCLDINIKHQECKMPPKVATWAIHGIWPSRNIGPMGPFHCDNTDKFSEDKIMDIESKLVVFWPNLIATEAKTSFWKHEWEKHGTCAKSLQEMGNEHRYFQTGLSLNQQFDFLQILKSNDILPSNTTYYQLSDMRTAIESETGSFIKMQCIFSKDKTEQALIQVEVCLNKNFTTIDCAAEKLRFVPEKIEPAVRSSDIPYNPAYETCTNDRPTWYYAFPST